jgi:hypothetical protein
VRAGWPTGNVTDLTHSAPDPDNPGWIEPEEA